MIQYQQTLEKAIIHKGIGLHSGREVVITLKPAAEDTGIVFVRTDLENKPKIHAIPENVSSTVRATTLSENGAEVFTIEHLMSALAALKVDNCIIEMSSPEPPVADGSSKVFANLIIEAGRKEQKAVRKVYEVDRTFTVYDEDKYIVILPYDGYRVSFTSINSHPLLGTQYLNFEVKEEEYLKEIASARTVAFTKELEMLEKMGLGRGGTIENVVVFDDKKILSVPRFENELIRHKVLDLIGDLYLLGPIKGHVIAVKTGHAANSNLAKQIQNYRKNK